MIQPAALMARMNRYISARRPHSPPVSAVRALRMRALSRRAPPWLDRMFHLLRIQGTKRVLAKAAGGRARTALPPRTGDRRRAARRPDLSPRKGLYRCGTVPESHRTSLRYPPPRAMRTRATATLTGHFDPSQGWLDAARSDNSTFPS